MTNRQILIRPHSLVTLVLGFSILLSTATTPSAETSASLIDEALVAALRGGGYNLYFRHVATDWSQSDHVREAGDWENCDTARMRQLSDAGRETAVEIGVAMRALGIPVGEVLASPYCRTVETASLLNLGPVETTTEVMNLRSAGYFGGRAAIVASAQALLASKPEPATNRVIVAHGNVANAATPVYPGEGDAVVFQPDGKGGFRFVGQIRPQDWAGLLSPVSE